MHGTAQAFRRAMAIGAAKSVSFEKKLNGVKFKISLKSVKNKKKIPLPTKQSYTHHSQQSASTNN